ncbi:tetratricopeptide repeat protein [Archangium sp.]|uniref:tetratricopeptide repeat protein n=1 Tax=Archangium sp. TaxID=1872627 RepID=UPI002D711CCF|nr:tetratricopeptide repeat protein [Archangium sp.]HYO54740.1 tetratricopeptide repeat protein [Archangium sp.]
MRWMWICALLSVAACSEKQQGSGAVQDKATVALGNKDEKCPGGTVKGCFDEAIEAERKGESARAVEMYTRVCDAGHARACSQLGTFVWQGRGVSADPARAYSLYMRACDGGDASGCFSAGVCHRTGTCAEKNDAEATKLIQRACDGGDKRACANLGGR